MEADWARWKYVVLFRTQVLFKNFNTFETKLLAVFTLETYYPSETGYPLHNSRQIDNTS